MPTVSRRSLYLVVTTLAVLWLGLLLGVSFIATPVKFAAPTLTLPVALDVGRVTFGLFSKIEWAMALLLLVNVVAARPSRTVVGATVITGLIVFFQALYLLPVLDERIAAVIAGSPQPASAHHAVYVWLEAAKALLLATIAVLAIRAAVRQPANPSASYRSRVTA
ncbi:MAG: hypothetical protein IBJ07_11875 [Rhizobiaceae bacterium]|nr:hypothetical protein [Rhizobiaceae bacterium]